MNNVAIKTQRKSEKLNWCNQQIVFEYKSLAIQNNIKFDILTFNVSFSKNVDYCMNDLLELKASKYDAIPGEYWIVISTLMGAIIFGCK